MLTFRIYNKMTLELKVLRINLLKQYLETVDSKWLLYHMDVLTSSRKNDNMRKNAFTAHHVFSRPNTTCFQIVENKYSSEH